MATKDQQYEGRLYTQAEVDEMLINAKIDALNLIHKRLAGSPLSGRGYSIMGRMLVESKNGYREALRKGGQNEQPF